MSVPRLCFIDSGASAFPNNTFWDNSGDVQGQTVSPDVVGEAAVWDIDSTAVVKVSSGRLSEQTRGARGDRWKPTAAASTVWAGRSPRPRWKPGQ